MNVTSLTSIGTFEDGANRLYEQQKHSGYSSWEDVLKNCTEEIPSMAFDSSHLSARSDNLGIIFKQESYLLGQLIPDGNGKRQQITSDLPGQREWQVRTIVGC